MKGHCHGFIDTSSLLRFATLLLAECKKIESMLCVWMSLATDNLDQKVRGKTWSVLQNVCAYRAKLDS